MTLSEPQAQRTLEGVEAGNADESLALATDAKARAALWGGWLEVNAPCRLERPKRRQSLVADSTVSTRCRSSSVLQEEKKQSRVIRFSPTDETAKQDIDLLSLSVWLCPRNLEASQPAKVKPALKKASVASRESAARRVSFSDVADVRELDARLEATEATAKSSVKPADEAFAAFRVKTQFEAETDLPPGLRSHSPATRYHSLGHHHHNMTTAIRPPIIDEGIAPPDNLAIAPLRTQSNEAQNVRIAIRKAPHLRIRVRRAFSRARMLHPHLSHHVHNGPLVLGEVPLGAVPPQILHIRVADGVATPLVAPSPTVLAEPPSTPLTAAALQRHEALMQQPQGDPSTDPMGLAGVPASVSLGMSMHQGAIFGVVSTIAVEALQLGLAQKRGSAVEQTATLASAAARGAAVGAAGGGMALLLGPVAPTAIFVGYGLLREWSAQGYAWLQNQTTGPLALSRAVEVSGSAAGGVACAMAVATVLSGFSGVVVAAAAGCSGFAGSLGGREVAAVCLEQLTAPSPRSARCRSRSSKSSKSSKRRRSSTSSTQLFPLEPQLLEAYSVLGVDPSCSNAELKSAYRQSVLRYDTDSQSFHGVLAAMEKIRSIRQTPLELDLVPDIWLDSRGTSRRSASSASHVGVESDRFLAGFLGGVAAQQAARSVM